MFKAEQVPDEQRPPQHSPSAAQFPPSETHADALQAPLTQLTLQQSGPELQDEPASRQTATVVHTWVVASHVPEQQSPELVHVVPAPKQPGGPDPPEPETPAPPDAPPFPDAPPAPDDPSCADPSV